LKETELNLVSELMKNSRRSDRDLAKALGLSQPTVTRLRAKMENEGVIKEYTMVPDFRKLGFNLMSIIMFKLRPLTEEQVQELHQAAREPDNQERQHYIMIMTGIGLGKHAAMVSLHKDYSSYAKYASNIKNGIHSRMKAFVDTEGIETFLIDLNYEHHFQPLTFSKIAEHLQKMEKGSS